MLGTPTKSSKREDDEVPFSQSKPEDTHHQDSEDENVDMNQNQKEVHQLQQSLEESNAEPEPETTTAHRRSLDSLQSHYFSCSSELKVSPATATLDPEPAHGGYYDDIYQWIRAVNSFTSLNELPEDPEISLMERRPFDFGEYYGITDFEGETGTDYGVDFDEKPLDVPILQKRNLLKVRSWVQFSPWHSLDDEYFKGVLRIQNMSPVNVTYSIHSTSPDKLQVCNPIGWLCPWEMRAVIVTTNPEYNCCFDDLKNESFIVLAHPVMFKSQLGDKKMLAFWTACGNGFIPQTYMESHTISEILSGVDFISKDYSMLDTLGLSFFKEKVEPLLVCKVPKMKKDRFMSIWNCENLEKEALLMEFKIHRMEKEMVEITKAKQRSSWIKSVMAVAFLFGLCYLIWNGYFEDANSTKISPSKPSIGSIGFRDLTTGKFKLGIKESEPMPENTDANPEPKTITAFLAHWYRLFVENLSFSTML